MKTPEEVSALKTLVEWKRNNDKLMDFLKKTEGSELDAANEEIKKHLIMETHKANLVLQAVAAELVESYVKNNPKTLAEIKA